MLAAYADAMHDDEGVPVIGKNNGTQHDDVRTVDAGHTQVSVSKTGTGPNLLFVHGWPLNGATWRNIVPGLDGFTRYVIDLPGAGASKATDATPLTMQGHVDTVVSVIDALGLEEVTLIGQDSGGLICRYVAAKRPAVVRSMVLAGTEIPGVHPPLVTLFKVLAKLPGSRALFRLNMGNRLLARLPIILGGTMHNKALLDGEFRTGLLDRILADDDAMDAAVKLIKDFDHGDSDALRDVHPELTMPVLLVWGEDDPFFPVEKARAMAAQFGGPTEFVAIDDAKLFVHEEYPERFAELTRAFVTDHVVNVAG